MKKIMITAIVFFGIMITVLIFSVERSGEGGVDRTADVVSDFDECVARGNPVMESYPRQCRSGDKVFVENVVEGDDEGRQEREIDERLIGRKWVWVKTEMNNDTSIVPKVDGVFTMSFESDGNVEITTDCNAVGGSYSTDGQEIIFGPLRSTKMYCEDAQEQEFVRMIEEVQQYMFNDEGQLVLLLKFDTGAIFFQ